jgi:hypothetical protein
MNWIVEGARADSGDERSITVEAETAGEAEQLGRQGGLLVAAVRPAAEDPIFDAVVVGTFPQAEPFPIQPQVESGSTVAPLTYATPQSESALGRATDPPSYAELRIGANVLRIIGLFLGGVGAIEALSKLWVLATMLLLGGIGGVSGAKIQLIWFAQTLSLFATGAALYVLGCAAIAIRDIARSRINDRE